MLQSNSNTNSIKHNGEHMNMRKTLTNVRREAEAKWCRMGFWIFHFQLNVVSSCLMLWLGLFTWPTLINKIICHMKNAHRKCLHLTMVQSHWEEERGCRCRLLSVILWHQDKWGKGPRSEMAFGCRINHSVIYAW